MRRVGDKIRSKRLAEAAGIPVIPWSGGPVADLDEASAAAERIGYPLFVKATGGGGGRGIRRVANPAELAGAFEAARAEARHAFGDPTVFLERQIAHARHVEVQVIADHHGGVWSAGLRDCTLQRRHQKVIEESSCTPLDARAGGRDPARPRPSCAGGRGTRTRARSSSCTPPSRSAGTSWR